MLSRPASPRYDINDLVRGHKLAFRGTVREFTKNGLRCVELSLPTSNQTHEVHMTKNPNRIWLSQLPEGRLIRIPLDEREGHIKNDVSCEVDAWGVGVSDPPQETYSLDTFRGICEPHGISQSIRYDGHLWITLQTPNVAVLINIEHPFDAAGRPKAVLRLPTCLRPYLVRDYPQQTPQLLFAPVVLTPDLEELGSGQQGTVFKAEYEGVPIAIKRYKSYDVVPDEAFLKELTAMMKVNGHPNIVRTIFVCLRDTREIGMEYISGKDLFVFLHRPKDSPSRKHVKDNLSNAKGDILHGIATALSYLRQHGVIHSDIKPGNVLLSIEGQNTVVPKLVDFGLVKVEQIALNLVTPVGSNARRRGTPLYKSPERVQLEDPGPSFAADVWAFGVLAWETLSEEIPFEPLLARPNFEQALREACQCNIIDQIMDQLPNKHLTTDLQDLLRHVLRVDPQERPEPDVIAERLRGIYLGGLQLPAEVVRLPQATWLGGPHAVKEYKGQLLITMKGTDPSTTAADKRELVQREDPAYGRPDCGCCDKQEILAHLRHVRGDNFSSANESWAVVEITLPNELPEQRIWGDQLTRTGNVRIMQTERSPPMADFFANGGAVASQDMSSRFFFKHADGKCEALVIPFVDPPRVDGFNEIPDSKRREIGGVGVVADHTRRSIFVAMIAQNACLFQIQNEKDPLEHVMHYFPSLTLDGKGVRFIHLAFGKPKVSSAVVYALSTSLLEPHNSIDAIVALEFEVDNNSEGLIYRRIQKIGWYVIDGKPCQAHRILCQSLSDDKPEMLFVTKFSQSQVLQILDVADFKMSQVRFSELGKVIEYYTSEAPSCGKDERWKQDMDGSGFAISRSFNILVDVIAKSYKGAFSKPHETQQFEATLGKSEPFSLIRMSLRLSASGLTFFSVRFKDRQSEKFVQEQGKCVEQVMTTFVADMLVDLYQRAQKESRLMKDDDEKARLQSVISPSLHLIGFAKCCVSTVFIISGAAVAAIVATVITSVTAGARASLSSNSSSQQDDNEDELIKHAESLVMQRIGTSESRVSQKPQRPNVALSTFDVPVELDLWSNQILSSPERFEERCYMIETLFVNYFRDINFALKDRSQFRENVDFITNFVRLWMVSLQLGMLSQMFTDSTEIYSFLEEQADQLHGLAQDFVDANPDTVDSAIVNMTLLLEPGVGDISKSDTTMKQIEDKIRGEFANADMDARIKIIRSNVYQARKGLQRIQEALPHFQENDARKDLEGLPLESGGDARSFVGSAAYKFVGALCGF